MKIRDLKKALENFSDDDVVVINGEVVSGFEKHKGRVRSGYYNDSFTKADKGSVSALVFTSVVQLSDGDIYEYPF